MCAVNNKKWGGVHTCINDLVGGTSKVIEAYRELSAEFSERCLMDLARIDELKVKVATLEAGKADQARVLAAEFRAQQAEARFKEANSKADTSAFNHIKLHWVIRKLQASPDNAKASMARQSRIFDRRLAAQELAAIEQVREADCEAHEARLQLNASESDLAAYGHFIDEPNDELDVAFVQGRAHGRAESHKEDLAASCINNDELSYLELWLTSVSDEAQRMRTGVAGIKKRKLAFEMAL